MTPVAKLVEAVIRAERLRIKSDVTPRRTTASLHAAEQAAAGFYEVKCIAERMGEDQIASAAGEVGQTYRGYAQRGIK